MLDGWTAIGKAPLIISGRAGCRELYPHDIISRAKHWTTECTGKGRLVEAMPSFKKCAQDKSETGRRRLAFTGALRLFPEMPARDAGCHVVILEPAYRPPPPPADFRRLHAAVFHRPHFSTLRAFVIILYQAKLREILMRRLSLRAAIAYRRHRSSL